MNIVTIYNSYNEVIYHDYFLNGRLMFRYYPGLEGTEIPSVSFFS